MATGFMLDFERPIVEMEQAIENLKKRSASQSINLDDEITQLTRKLQHARRQVYQNLTPWQRVQMARHPQRPYTLDYIGSLMTDFVELHGDRAFSDDKALIGGFARFEGTRVMVVGHQKGRDTKENLYRNFGSAHPEGYRKAMRLMELASKFRLPILSFVDTPGAYPGIGAEERGQAQAIALNLREMARLKVPVIVTVIGEGGSGGALGIGVGDRVLVLENAYYSVISPEGCAAILWKDRLKAPDAAANLKLTAKDLLKLKLIDEAVPEPIGGAHRDPKKTAMNLKTILLKHLKALEGLSPAELTAGRMEKYRRMGFYTES
ncbi:MAG: acetyl-CoA carboxylase carboxyl transferase subunit alpha [Candidatus Omnitrophica bacterium CG11_big_fil_rev_8_21_14_0_20_64_10]|nr:MAG: acetyl-CoA carboxylase carboxyl transferase subunit alpha [Candidatus Omnitrophica bacterium CG11_big_fil_rev_8_21_14_0_20_64_10]